MREASRRLSVGFVEDLRAGLLGPLCDRVRCDASLDLQIRANYLNLYYRGGSLAKISPHREGGYVAKFDARYFRGEPPTDLPSRMGTAAEVLAWIEAVPILKDAMDRFGMNEEREIQQRLVRDNNVSASALCTDYYICDVEYAVGRSRFDFVGVRWPSDSSARKLAKGHRLMLGELKLGDSSLRGESGVHEHVRDADDFLGSPERVRKLEDECLESFALKRELGLVNCNRDLEAFGRELPLLLLVFANHDPDSSTLREVLRELPACKHAEVRIMRSSLLGYALFDASSWSLEEACAQL